MVALLLRDIYSVLGRRYALYLALVTLTGLMEGVSLATVVPLLTMIGIGAGTPNGTGAVGGVVLPVLERLGIQPSVASLGIIVASALALSTVLFLAQAYAGTRLQTAYVYHWQQRLIRAMFLARWNYFQQHRNGDLVSAVVTETNRLGGAFYQAGLLLTGVVHSALYLAVAFALAGRPTALMLAGGSMLFMVTRPLIRRAYQQGTSIAQENAEFQSMAGELLSGAKLVKATATEADAVTLLTGPADRLRRHTFANAFEVQVVKAAFDFGAAIICGGVLVAGPLVLGSDPAVTLVVLAIFVRLMPKLTGVQYSLHSLTVSLPVVALLRTLAAEAEDQAEPQSSEPLPNSLREGPLAISLRDVHVQYGDVNALSGISLEIPAGSCVAFVGGSGAGKSSLADAVVGLVPVCRGAIAINGIPLDRLPRASLRRRIGYVGQETVLYNASIRDNVAWGKPRCSPAELDDAVRVAGAHAFIARLSRGYDTLIGDCGSLLSGGERQRLGLARAAVGRPGLLILDEATSALDAETERIVTDAVAAFNGKCTVIMIAHRLSSARIADRVAVVEGGRIVEYGTWDELIQKRGRLSELWALQYPGDLTTTAHAAPQA